MCAGEMSPRGLAAWPPWALLLLWLPGPSVRAWFPGLCLSGCDPLSMPSTVTGTVGISLSSPSMVTGTVGGSLSVHCHYDEKLKDNHKSWCKQSLVFCDDVVKTNHSEREVRSNRTSLSDHPANLSFTVTMERLTLQDAGSYQCQVDTPWHEGLDPFFRVEVAVLPALAPASSSESPTSTQGPPTSLPPHTWPITTREDAPSPHPQPGDRGVLCGTALVSAGPQVDPSGHRTWGSLVISVHLLLLILKVLLLLSLLSAVLWVNRPQRSSGARRRRQDSEHQ